nr:uncharacterized protein LOC112031976 [Quercus suber]
METSAMAGNALNVDVPVALRLRIDVEMTTDTLEKAASSSPPAASHHPNDGDVSTKGGGSSLGVGELSQKISNPVLDPKYTGTYAEGDPFLVKLQEIDSDLQKFECQNDEIVLLGSDMEQGISKAPNGSDGKGKIGLGPGPQKEKKKGQWTRITKGPNYDVVEEVIFGADGLKHKAWETQAREKLNIEKEKKTKDRGGDKKTMWALCFTVGIGGGCGATPPGAMSILCWNCRGLGNQQTVQELGDLIRAQDPTVVFLTETWLDDCRLAGLGDSLHFGHYHGVSRLTRGGGLVLFWKKGFDLQVMSSSKNHIDVLINKGMEIGDFNELLKSHKKLGGRLRPYGQMQKFREALDECGLFDLGFVGNKFTWYKTYPGGSVVWERLDRAVSTNDWFNLFPATKLQTWSKQSFCKVVSTLSEKKKILKEAEESATKGGCVDFFLQLKAEVAELLRVEEKMWQQRSHVHWMMSSDKNSSYFHNRASQRFRRNSITEIKDSLGRKASGDKEVSVLFLDYFKHLFTTSNLHDIEEVVQHSKKVVSEEMNNCLISNFSKDEVEIALKQMAPLKAPGPDGMPPIFFQHYWENIGDEVVRAVVSCLNSNSIVPSLNHTFITLIPKVKSPEFVSEFRPIALCNILYKLVSKVLANRLKKILTHVISESQSAFQSDKAIFDNILVAFETLHHMKRKRTGKMGQMALKLDMSKAYDRLEWVFLQRIMEKMGFHSKWIGWIMECVKSVPYSILVNGEPKGHIILTRGIRQGDPLSPYLFLLCSEGLNGLIENAVDCKHIEGVSLCRNGPKISHIFFADDSLLFCRARVGDVEKIQECLGKYERASGQKINTDKTTLFFSKNTFIATKEELKILLGVPEIKEYERTLKCSFENFGGVKGEIGEKFIGQNGRFYANQRVKGVWRLIHNKESLFYRVFKGKYFPNCSIFEANSSSGSFTWKSIMWSREVIEKGSFWGIGNGKSVQIYKDSWLPSPDGRISSPVSHLTPESTVDSLINSTLGGWNTNLIDLCFYPPQAILIKSLPLGSTPQPDTLVWRPEKSGCYSVKSGYKLLCELLIPNTNRLQVPVSSRGF